MEVQLDSRLDLEIYIMGEMKYEFLSFLGECFKENFIETLSWGNFRRFQLILHNEKNWINIHFILLKNESNADVLINSFKIYEKRNITLLLYNVHDQKSEKNIENLYESLIFERNKFYEGILNDDSVNASIKRISSNSNYDKLKITSDSLKNNLKFLTEKEENLIFKIGFYPNIVNKKTKNVKKMDNSTNNSYFIENDIFYVEDDDPTNFTGLINFILKKTFKKFMITSNLDIFKDVLYQSTKKEIIVKNKEEDLMNYFVKGVDWMIIVYILVSIYKYYSSEI